MKTIPLLHSRFITVAMEIKKNIGNIQKNVLEKPVFFF